MYRPPRYRVDDLGELHAFIDHYAFGTLFTQTPDGPFATHLPFLIDPARGAFGTLTAHVARANPHWRSFSETTTVLATFIGPHAYVSPAWYTSPVAVPTWNYTAVHASGVARMIEDRHQLRAHVLAMVDRYRDANVPPWDPAHTDTIMENLLGAIVGFEIPIARIEGKYKLSQNRSPEDQQRVATALHHIASPDTLTLARLMRENLEPPAPTPTPDP